MLNVMQAIASRHKTFGHSIFEISIKFRLYESRLTPEMDSFPWPVLLHGAPGNVLQIKIVRRVQMERAARS